MIAIRTSVNMGVRSRPPHDDGRIVCKTLHPYVMDIQNQARTQTTKPLKPGPQGLLVMVFLH